MVDVETQEKGRGGETGSYTRLLSAHMFIMILSTYEQDSH